LICIEGDATDDDILKQADISNTSGLFAVLPDDKSNLFACLSARSLAPEIRIIALAGDPVKAGPKLTKAGANAVVSASALGGLRIASEISRPSATAMLDKIMRSNPHELRILEIEIKAGSKADGKTLGELNVRSETGLGIIAIMKHKEPFPVYNPGSGFKTMPGDKLVLLGGDSEEKKIRLYTEPF